MIQASVHQELACPQIGMNREQPELCMEGEVGMLNSEWEGLGWEIRATSLVAKARAKEARVKCTHSIVLPTNTSLCL